MSLLVISKILKLFVNTLTADHKYSLRNSRNLPQQIPMQLSKKQKLFFYDYASFLKFTSFTKFILNCLKKNTMLIAYVLSILETPKNVVT